MADNKQLHEYVLEQCKELSGITWISMMGGYIYYIKGRIFGGIYGSSFLVKITEASKKYMPDSEAEPPYEGAKPMLPVTIIEDGEALRQMIEEMYEELPDPKPKRKKIASKSGLAKLPNIGLKVQEQLEEVGIMSYEELKAIGAKEAWLKIQAIDKSACIHRLMALEGAIQGVKKTLLPETCKKELKEFYQAHKITG